MFPDGVAVAVLGDLVGILVEKLKDRIAFLN
jgi:hypothetical protein